jgi:hypothetical protein
MNLTEILKSKGVTDDVIKAVLEDMKTNKIYTAGEENLDVRYSKLKADHEGLSKQYAEANTLIEELKKSSKGNEDLQGKITGYETQVAQLQAELDKAKLDNAIQLALRDAKAVDPDYLAYKLREKYKPEELTLDENGKVKGMDDKLAGLKTQFPAQFEASGQKKILENKLDVGEPGEVEPKNLEDALKLAYEPKKE